MLPDRAKFYDSLKNYNSLQHANKNSMYGLEYDEHSYYKREGEPGNYRYYWTKQEYEAHLAELEKQRNKNMQAGQNYEADRWKKNDQNKMKNQQIKNNSQANAEADRWKRNDQNKLKEQQIKNNSQANAEADRWKRDQENKEKEKQRQENIRKNAEASLHDGDRYERYKKEKEIREKNQGNNPEADRYARLTEQQKREKQIKDAQERVKQREIAKKNEGNNAEADRYARLAEQQKREKQIADAKARVAEREREQNNAKNLGNNPEADRWKRQEEQRKQQEQKDFQKKVDRAEIDRELQKALTQTDEQYNKGKTERQNKLKEAKEDLFDMTNYYREKNGNEDFDKSFEEAKKSAGVENLYIHGGDIKYYDKELEDKISDMKSKMSELGRKNGELESRNSNSNIDSRTKASNENQYQTNLNEIRKLEREIELTESKMRQKAYSAYEQVLDQMYSNKENGLSLQSARERKQLEHEQWVKEQEGDWIDQIKKKAKKFFS